LSLLASVRDYEGQYSGAVALKASAEQVFAFADDFIKLSSHMGTASLMMMGSSMHTPFALNSVTEEGLRLGGRILLAPLRIPANFRHFNIIKFRATPTPDD
jgi:hypothetical protein